MIVVKYFEYGYDIIYILMFVVSYWFLIIFKFCLKKRNFYYFSSVLLLPNEIKPIFCNLYTWFVVKYYECDYDIIYICLFIYLYLSSASGIPGATWTYTRSTVREPQPIFNRDIYHQSHLIRGRMALFGLHDLSVTFDTVDHTILSADSEMYSEARACHIMDCILYFYRNQLVLSAVFCWYHQLHDVMYPRKVSMDLCYFCCIQQT